MLSKLFKHEFQVTGKMFLLLYVAVFVVTIFSKLMLLIEINNTLFRRLQGVLTVVYVILLVALSMITVIFIVMRFYKNMLCDEAYLTFTLPVTVTQHLIVKTVVATVWTVASIIVTITSILLLIWSADVAHEINELWDIIKQILEIDASGALMVSMIAAIIISVISVPIMAYASMAIGQLFTKHKIIGSIVGYFIINTVSQVLSTIVMFATSFAYRGATNLDAIAQLESDMNMLTVTMWGQVAVTAALIVAEFFFTKYMLQNKLNLE